MKRIYSIFEAKARLSEIIRIVRTRQEVIITDRSQPVVKVVPFELEKTAGLADRLDLLERAGQVSRRPGRVVQPIQCSMPKNLVGKFLKDRA